MTANPHRYTLNHTMLRVKDPSASLAFYCGTVGMSLLRKVDIEAGAFSLYFLAFLEEGEAIPKEGGALAEFVFGRPGVLELTHNWGTEDDPDFAYHDGNTPPQGFGHIALAVPDLDQAVARFDEAGARFVKRPEDGAMRHIAFVVDPDGYWIELLTPRAMAG